MSEKSYSTKFGSPFDRGAADAYYSGYPHPNKLVPTGSGAAVVEVDLTDPEEIEAYYAGFDSISKTDRKKYD